MRASHRTPVVANRKIPETYTLRRATRYGGFNALSDFVAAQGIDRALTDAFGQDKAPWATYTLPETLRHLLDGYLLGVERVWHFAESGAGAACSASSAIARGCPITRCSIGSWRDSTRPGC